MTGQAAPTDSSPTASPPPPPGAAPGIGGLLDELFAGLAQLFRDEIALARSELRAGVQSLRTGLILLVLAAVLALVALNGAAATAVLALVGAGLSPVLAAGLVAGAVLALAALCLWMGLRRLSASRLKPRRSLAALQRDGETLFNMVKSDA